MTTPPTDKQSLGIRAFGRFALLTLFSLAFLALAVADYWMGAPLVVVLAYLFCAAIMGMLASKMFPKRVKLSRQPKTRAPERSGNPAVRAQQQPNPRSGKDATGR